MPEKSPESGQAGVEITPEMIQAGIDELLEYRPEQDEAKLVVCWIFEAMMRAHAGLLHPKNPQFGSEF